MLDSRSLTFADEIRAITGGEGVDVVLSAAAGETVDRNISCLAAYGRYVEIGKRDLLGDGECSEGAVWEAAQFASLNHLANLVAIVDVNGLGQSEPAPYRHDTGVFARRFAAFGWRIIEIDGHDMAAILNALQFAHEGGPTAILARTEKGKGVSFMENNPKFHGTAPTSAEVQTALQELQ